MNKPKVGILLNEEMRRKVISPKEYKRLKSFALVEKTIKGADGVITGWGTPKLTKGLLDEAPNLRIIAHSAGPVKPIVSDEVWERKIIVTTVAPSIAIGVAEFTLGLIITGLKRVYSLNKITHQGGWRKEKEIEKVKEFYKIIIGIVGASYVGRHLISLLKNFDVRLLLYDPYISREEAERLGVEKVSLNKLMRGSDVVSLHAPSLPLTYHMINKENLKLMKENSLLINTARGSLINEKALIEVLRRKKIFALLDVTDLEPPDKRNPLRKMENVVLTPHIAGAVTNNILRQGNFAIPELERFFSGKPPLYPVTKEILKEIA